MHSWRALFWSVLNRTNIFSCHLCPYSWDRILWYSSRSPRWRWLKVFLTGLCRDRTKLDWLWTLGTSIGSVGTRSGSRHAVHFEWKQTRSFSKIFSSEFRVLRSVFVWALRRLAICICLFEGHVEQFHSICTLLNVGWHKTNPQSLHGSIHKC